MPRGKTVKRGRSSSTSVVSPKKKKVEKIIQNSDAPVENGKIKRAKDKAIEIEPQPLKRPDSEGGVLFAFGAGDVGQLGLGDDVLEKSRPALIPDFKDIVEICAGGMHNICLMKNGSVYSWGCNDEGALGRTDSESVPGLIKLPAPAVMVSAGDSHSAALLEDYRVFAWGSFRDASGNMGLIKQGIEKEPVEIMPNYFFTKIASGSDHLVLLSDKGDVYTMGCGQQGQLGRLSSRETVRERRFGIVSSLQPSLVSIKTTKKIKSNNIWASTYGTFISVKETGAIYVFGLNNYHQIGLNKEEPYFRPTESRMFTGKTWEKISGGLHHTIALDTSGNVYALGRKEYGRLGLGENCEDATELTLIPKFQDKKCIDVACGATTSYAVTEDGELYSWGMGSNGALGLGNDDDDAYEPKLVKSKQLMDHVVLKVSSGGQHSILIAKKNKTTQQEDTKPSIES